MKRGFSVVCSDANCDWRVEVGGPTEQAVLNIVNELSMSHRAAAHDTTEQTDGEVLRRAAWILPRRMKRPDSIVARAFVRVLTKAASECDAKDRAAAR